MSKKKFKSGKMSVNALSGLRDLVPPESRIWQFFEERLARHAASYGFLRVDTPLIEFSRLFERVIGEKTDLAQTGLYRFLHEEEEVALRPEFTSGIARAFVERKLERFGLPLKVYGYGPVYRRMPTDETGVYALSQSTEYNFELIGDAHPIHDARMILMAYFLLLELGIPVTVSVNSLGDVASRSEYATKLKEFLRTKKKDLCEDCRLRMEKNILRIFDCSQAPCQEILADAPQIIDWLDEASRDHFVKVLEFLDELDVPYVLAPRLLRGCDYYVRTVFELVATNGGTGIVLGGGGRFNQVIESLGGSETPAVGYAGNTEQTLEFLKDRSLVPHDTRPHVFLAQLGVEPRKRALKIFEELRRAGISTDVHFSKDGLSAQLELAAKAGVPFTVIIGQKELLDKTIIIRDMESGIQETVDLEKIVHELRKRLSKLPAQIQPSVPNELVHDIVPPENPNQINLFRPEY